VQESPVHTQQRLSQQRMSRFLAAVLAVVPIAVSNARAAEPAAIGEAAVDRMIGLNKKAYADITEGHFQAAKYRLTEALVISETAGLENDEMTARTYLHLAVVFQTGLKDREEAVKQFMLALRIDPNITITRGLESPSLRSAYLQAREQMELPPNPDTTAPPLSQVAAATQTPAQAPASASERILPPPAEKEDRARQPSRESNVGAIKDPDLPARVPSPLHCPLPFDIPAGEDFVMRCLTQKQQKKSNATFYFRQGGASEGYVALPMERSPKGWLVAIVPGRVVQGTSLPYYVKAQLPGSQEALYLGHPEAPNALMIRNLPNPDAAEDDAEDATEQPVVDVGAERARPAAGESARPSRLRAPGAFWIALAGGTGAVYHGYEAVDSNTKVPNTNTTVHVQAGFSPAAIFQLEPEVGYQVSKRFSVSVMGRYQVAPKDSNGYVPGTGEHAVLTSAFAGFARAQFAFISKSAFQTYASGGAGLGTSFLATAGKHCGTNSCTLDHSDTLHGGPVALTVGAGAIYHLDARFGVFVEVKEIATLPKVMALTEVNMGLAFTHKFQNSNERKAANSTRHVSWR
jgi:hypothetical protein